MRTSAVSTVGVRKGQTRGGEGGGIITRQGEEEEVCSTHAYDGLMLFCMS